MGGDTSGGGLRSFVRRHQVHDRNGRRQASSSGYGNRSWTRLSGNSFPIAGWEIFERDFLPALRPTPGARALVQRIRDDGLDLIVATSAGGDEVGVLLEAAEVADLYDAMTSSSDAEDSKPDPDIVQAAVRKSGFDGADDLIMVGDTPYDVEAAIGAHVKIIALLCGGWTQEELSGAAANLPASCRSSEVV